MINGIGEINAEYYCSANCFDNGKCIIARLVSGDCTFTDCKPHCQNYHHKWPTPAQFKKEYGFDYPETASVYFRKQGDMFFQTVDFLYVKYFQNNDDFFIFCACTPYGAPYVEKRKGARMENEKGEKSFAAV